MSTSQATVLARWSLGMVLARSWALPAVRAFLATWLGRTEPAVSQQVREVCSEATATRGTARQEWVVETCCGPVLPWGVDQWEGTQVALALAATTVGDRLTVLALRGVDRGCAIPVTWTVLAATATHAWRREGLRMLRPGHRAGPWAWPVLVLAERGLQARGWFRRIPRLGGHPFVRITLGGTFRPTGQVQGVPLQRVVPEPGTTWQGPGIAFHGRHRQRHCPLLAWWEPGYTAPWVLLTDRPPAASTAWWYGLRAWMAQGFKIPKRAGWPWQRTRMTKPERAARLWRAVAVAPLGWLSVGGEADATIPTSTVLAVTARVPQPRRPRRATRLRLVSGLRRGWTLILVALLAQAPLPRGRFVPEPWPAVPVPEEAPALQGLALPQAA